jgi:type IV pilus assembly protein PilQ
VAPFTLDHGQRLVLDLKNAILTADPQAPLPGDTGLAAGVRGSLYRLNPQFESRIVFDLRTSAVHTLTAEPGLTTIRVSSSSKSAYADLEICIRWDAESKSVPAAHTLAADLLALSAVPPQPAVVTIDNALLESLLHDDLSTLAQPNRAERRPGLAQDLMAVAALKPNLNLGQMARAGATDGVTAPLVFGQLSAEEGDELTENDASAPAIEEGTEVVEASDAAEDDLEVPIDEDAAVSEEPLPPPARDTVADTVDANRTLSTIQRALQSVGVLDDGTGAATATSTSLEFQSPGTVPARLSAPPVSPPPPAWKGDPMDMPVNLDFREMPMVQVVQLLKTMAGINIIAGTQLSERDTVSVNLEGVPLRKALETVLRINGLGLVYEDGIYRIVSFDEALAAERVTRVVQIEHGRANEIARLLTDVLVGSPDARTVNVTSNEVTGTLVISGPESKVSELIALAQSLDIEETVLPTVTEAIKLNYAEPTEMEGLITTMLTKDIGQVSADQRARFLVVTDVPAVVEQVRMLISQLDMPVRQVAIDSMVVDATMTDDASTGIDWLISAVRRQSARDAALGTDRFVSDLQTLDLATDLGLGDTAGLLTFGILNDNIDIRGTIQAEVRNQNGNLLSNPVVVTVENKPATITIAQEIPFIELTETNAGGSQTNTEFKEIGTVLTVTPRVTHDDHIIVEVEGKESGTAGEFQGVPIEDKREVSTTIRVRNGQTIFIGGLRKNDNDKTVRKVPILGDVPVVNFLFRQDITTERTSELMIFLTCNVLPDDYPGLAPRQQMEYDKGVNMPMKPDAHFNQVHSFLHPSEMRDPLWNVRRSD